MSINIKTASGLLEIGGSATKESIIAALKYTPADNKTIEEHIDNASVHISESDRANWNNKDYNSLENAPNLTDDESGDLIIVDKDGNAIARFDEGGLTTTNVNTKTIRLNGEDLSDLLDEIESGILPNILDNESGDFVIADGNGNAVLKVDAGGLETTSVTARSVTINGVDVAATIIGHASQLTEYSKDIEDLDEALTTHTSDNVSHITGIERALWNNKSDFSGNYADLTDAPSIVEDGSGEVVYVDENSNIILKVNDNGVESTRVMANTITVGGTDIGAHIADTNIHTAYANATSINSGLMSARDKAKLDSIETGANAYVLPAASSTTLGGIKLSLVGTTLYITTK